YQLVEAGEGCPAEFLSGLGGVALEDVDLGGAIEFGIYGYELLVVESDTGEGQAAEFADAGGAAGGDDEVFGLGLLEDAPHGVDVVAGEPPVAFGFKVAELEFLLDSLLDSGHAVGDLAGDELDAAQRRLVIEQDAAGGVHAEAFAIVDGAPVGVELGYAVGAARVKRRLFVLDGLLDLAEHLAGRGLVVARLGIGEADGFEQVDGAESGDVAGEHGLHPGGGDEALRAEVVDLVHREVREAANERRLVGEVAFDVLDIVVDAEVAEAPRCVGRAPCQQSVNFVALLEEELGKIGSVLSGDAGNECSFAHAHAV